MTDLKINEKLEKLYESINKEEKKGKDKNNNVTIINSINNLEKELKKDKEINNKDIIEDVISSLKINKDAYHYKTKDNFFREKEKMTEKFYAEKNKNSTKESIDLKEEENKIEDDIDEFEVVETPIIKELNERCDKINSILMSYEIKEENNNIEKLKMSILKVKTEINKLKPIDNDAIKRLNEQINAIRRESNKLSKIMTKKKIY